VHYDQGFAEVPNQELAATGTITSNPGARRRTLKQGPRPAAPTDVTLLSRVRLWDLDLEPSGPAPTRRGASVRARSPWGAPLCAPDPAGQRDGTFSDHRALTVKPGEVTFVTYGVKAAHRGQGRFD